MLRKDSKISLIILNWKRPDGVKMICRQLENEDIVNEIIVWNNNPDLHFEAFGKKMRVVNTSQDFGLFTRFAAASLAKNECILFHDDDIMAPVETLNVLFQKWRKEPMICHTAFGRNPKNGEYSMNTQYGTVEIVLTRFVMAHRRVCVHALSKIPEFADMPGKPVGNGEDIILSYAAIDYSGKLNRAYDLETKDLFDDDEHAINARFAGHIAHRTKVIQRCKTVFNPGKRLILWNRIYQFFVKTRIVLERKYGNPKE